ncbi:MAG: hypothetical protein IJ123_07900 [Blautia sp.]|nr:hypothetical protein [Blautia sp.]
MKRWTKRMIILLAALALSILAAAFVSAADNNSYMPLDGKERQFSKLGGQEDEPAIVGAETGLKRTYWGYDRANDAEIYRIFVTGYGLLTVGGKTSSNGSLKMQLLDRHGNNVNANSGWKYINSSSNSYAYYGVQRGPYYIKVYSSTYYYSIGATEALKSNLGGSSSYYSRSMNFNKTYCGVMPCNEDWRNCDWYTFYLSSPHRIRLFFTTKGDGYFNLRVYGPGNYSKGELLDSWVINEQASYDLYKKSSLYGGQYSREAGRYYVKVERSSYNYRRSSCAYWLRWKTY